MNNEVERFEETREGITVSVVRLAPAFAKSIRFSQPILSEFFSADFPSELFVGDELFMTNVDTFIKKRKMEEASAMRYLGSNGTVVRYFFGMKQRDEFDRLWKNCLALYGYAWIGDQVGIEKNRGVLSEDVEKLTRLLATVDDDGWASWHRLNTIIQDDFLTATDSAFDRFLSASSTSLPDAKRAKVEQLWREIQPKKREFVKAFIKGNMPLSIQSKFELALSGSIESLDQTDVRFLFSQALKEFARHKMRRLDSQLKDFDWNYEVGYLLRKLEYVLTEAEKNFDIEKVLTEVVYEAMDKGNEVRTAIKEINTIFIRRDGRGSFLTRLKEIDIPGEFPANELIREMLTEHAPSLLDLLRMEDAK